MVVPVTSFVLKILTFFFIEFIAIHSVFSKYAHSVYHFRKPNDYRQNNFFIVVYAIVNMHFFLVFHNVYKRASEEGPGFTPLNLSERGPGSTPA